MMDLNKGFWIKFVILFLALVIFPLFFLDFTQSFNIGTKIMMSLAGAGGIVLALSGKALGRKKR